MKKILILIITLISCISCDVDERIDMNTMIVVGEEAYDTSNSYNVDSSLGMSVYRIKYESLNHNNGLDIYIVTNSDAFEVGDKVKIVKVEE